MNLIRQMARFLGVGVINTAVGLGLIWALMALGMAPLPANFIGYAVGLCLSFTLNRRYTFRDGGQDMLTVMRFLLAFAMAYILNALVLTIGLAQTEISAYLMQVLAMGVYTASFFTLCRLFVFRTQLS